MGFGLWSPSEEVARRATLATVRARKRSFTGPGCVSWALVGTGMSASYDNVRCGPQILNGAHYPGVTGATKTRYEVTRMTADGQKDRRLLSEAVQEPRPKPALGAPHDAYATVCLTVAIAAAVFFTGRASGEDDALGWIGMLTSFAVVIIAMYYFQRAYGFASRGWENAPMGAMVSAYFGVMLLMRFVPAALYQQYFHESLLAYSLSCLAVAALPMAVLRTALGQAAPAE